MNEFTLQKKYNWETAHDPLVKKYVADLYQDGTAGADPIMTELFNNTGVSFEIFYGLGPGFYVVVASKPIFTTFIPDNTQTAITNPIQITGGPGDYSITVYPVFEDTIFIFTSDTSAPADGILGNYMQNALEITFYN